MRTTAFAALVVVILVSVPRALCAQDAQTPTFRAGVETLPVDVSVVDDKGQPVRDLIAADFTVRIDGRARRVVSAQWVAASTATAAATAAARLPEGYVSNEMAAGGRMIVIVVDQPNIPFGEVRQIRDAIDTFIDRLSSADRAAVVGLGQPPVSTPFTADKTVLKQAVDRIPGQRQSPSGGSTHEIPMTAALAIDSGDEAAVEQVAARDCPGQNRRQREACMQEIRNEAMEVASEARQAGATTLNGLRDVLASLKAIDGPKTIVFVSQGFFADRNRGDDVARLNEFGGLASAARVHVYSMRLDDSSTIGQQKAGQPQLNQEDTMNKRYALETLTSAAGGALFNIAGTGAGVFDRLSSELSGYYLLGLETDAGDRNGKPHPIRVDIARPNVAIRAQRTMVAGTAADAAAAARTPQQIVTAALSSPLPASSLPMRAIAFSFRGLDAGKVRLLIHTEIGSGYTAPQRMPVAYYVFDKTGKSVDGQMTDVRLSPAANGVPSAVIFTGGASVDPGDYIIKVVAADGERVGSIELPIHATLLDLGGVRLTELVAGGPVPPVNLLRPSVGARVSFGSVHGYMEAYGPEAAALRVKFEVAAEERGPAILNADVQGVIVGEERVVFSTAMLVQALPPGEYRLRALVYKDNSLLTTLARVFEIAPPEGAIVAKNADAASIPGAPGALLYLPVEQRDMQRPFDRDAALKPDVLEAFQQRVPAPGRAAFDEGIAHLQKRDYRDAEASFKKAVQPDADSSGALAYLGVTYAAAGRDTQAANVWRTAMNGADDIPQMYEWLGESLMRLKSSGEARPVFEEAMTRFPADGRFARPLAMLYATFGRGIDAVRLLEKSLAQQHDDQALLFLAVEWIFNAHRGGAVVHDRTEDARLAHEYAAQYLKAGGLNEPLVKQWLNYLDKETP